MVKKVVALLGREIKGLHEAAYLLGTFAFISQILGLFRDRLFASYFGPSEILDVYYASFRIPDLLFVVVIALVSTSVLIPFLVKYISGKEKMEEFVNSVYSALAIFSVIFAVIIFFFAETLLSWFVPDLLAGSLGDELVVMTKILLLQPILLALSSLFSSILQVYKKFFIYALSPIVYNLGIISGILVFYPMYGIYGLSYGVVLGALLHFAIQIPFVQSKTKLPRLTFSINWQKVGEVFMLSVPRTVALLSNQVVQLVFVAIAATLTVGSISIFNFAYNLQAVPLSIIGVSYSLAAFPTLSKYFSSGDTKSFLSYISKAARHIIFWSIPIMILFIVLRAQVVRTILGSGEFTWDDTRLVAAALAVFAISVVAQSLVVLFVRGYYASGETKRPFIVAVISTAVTIALAYIFVHIFKDGTAFKATVERILRVEGIQGTVVLMLPLAYAVGQLLQATILWVSFDRRFKHFSDSLWKTIFHSLSSSIVMGVVTFVGLQILDDYFDLETFWGIFSQGLFAGILGILAGILTLTLLDNQEIKIVFKTLHRKFWRTKLVAAESEEI